MNDAVSELPLGYASLKAGHIAAVVTNLEMLSPPAKPMPRPFPPGVSLAPLERSDLSAYRTLYRKVGEDWLWYSRLVMADDELRAFFDDPRVDIFALRKDEQTIGLLELDFRQDRQCELAFFGLIAEAIGQGLGRALMNAALERAWSRPIDRLWLHTCTFDHPAAVGFYIRSGFRPYAFQVEVAPDPRLSGHLPPQAAPHVPLIAPNLL